MTYGSLFTGIDAFGLAADELGCQTLFGCDIMALPKVHFQERHPNAIWFDDIKRIEYIPRTYILSFGFPCQDASLAGNKRTNLNGERTGLFFEAIRLVRGARPDVVIVENVPPLLKDGWDEVAGAFAESGYHFGWAVIPASSFGAEFQGNRIYGVAASDRFRRHEVVGIFERLAQEVLRQKTQWHKDMERERCRAIRTYTQFKTNVGVHGDVDGIPYWLYEGVRAKAVGNSVYYPIAKAIMIEVTKIF